jgi:hypothetical protein
MVRLEVAIEEIVPAEGWEMHFGRDRLTG